MLKTSQLYYSNYIKRFFDINFSIFLILLLTPLFLSVFIIIILNSGLPSIHKRKCLGLDGQPFLMLKFRTMINNADEVLDKWKKQGDPRWFDYQKNIKLDNDPRVIPLGNVLRKTSLDELPQLVNVLKGDMSLIGPRPISISEEEKIDAKTLEMRYMVKPGISGLWQVSGRQETTYEERLELDKEYIMSISFMNDIKIFFKTILVVLIKKGAI